MKWFAILLAAAGLFLERVFYKGDAHDAPVRAITPVTTRLPVGRRTIAVRPSEEYRGTPMKQPSELTREQLEEIVDVLVGKKIDLERLATHRFSIDEAEIAFRLFDERKTEKAVFVF